LLRRLQRGENLGLPHSRPLPNIGRRCHELRIPDTGANWRIVYRLDPDAVMIAEVFSKKTAQLPKATLDVCRARLRQYDATTESEE
jgi:phage-related protein